MPTERTYMKPITSRISLILTGGTLLAGLLLLSEGRLEYCGRQEASQPSANAVTTTDALTPTLAPPLKVVFVRVEADKSDLEVSWLDN
jgi:hypothetical protein